jgi:hypothetical protein
MSKCAVKALIWNERKAYAGSSTRHTRLRASRWGSAPPGARRGEQHAPERRDEGEIGPQEAMLG